LKNHYRELRVAQQVESLVLADRASELIENVDVGLTGQEHYAVADVYQYGGFLGEAHRVATDGLAVADTDVGRIWLLRKLAIIEATMSGDVSAIAERLTDALELSQQSDDQTAAWTDYETEQLWAWLLASLRECPAALEHAQEAKNHLADVSPFSVSDSTGLK
jgi:hypothetical protein